MTSENTHVDDGLSALFAVPIFSSRTVMTVPGTRVANDCVLTARNPAKITVRLHALCYKGP